MLIPARIKKLRVIALKDHRYTLIKRLHELGVVHITNVWEEFPDELSKSYADPLGRKTASLGMDLSRIMDVFQTVDPVEGEGFIRRLLYPSSPKKIPVDDVFGEELVKDVEKLLEEVKTEISEPKEKYFSSEEKIAGLEELKKSIERIRNLDVDLSWIGKGEFVSVFVGLVPADLHDSLVAGIKGTPYTSIGSIKTETEEEIIVVIAVLNEHADEIISAARRLGFEQVSLSGLKGSPMDALGEVQSEIERVENEKECAKDELVELSRKYMDRIEATRESLSIEREKRDVSASFAETEDTFMLEGWIEEKKGEWIKKEIETSTERYSIVEIADPDEDDDIPVKLDNPPIIRSFEVLTRLFASPKNGEVDPTILIAVMFPILFGFMVGDAFYGLIVAIVGYFLYRGAGRIDESIRDWSIVILTMGVATIILGALQGCYLGDFHTRFLGMEKETYPYLVDPLGINPMAETITVLQIALIIGLIHLNLGLVLGAVKNIQAGNRRDLISGQISLFVLQPSVAVLICKLFGWWGWASLPLTSTPMLIALAGVVIGALMLLIPKGLLGIFDITGYLGNWLSYARILALGLATSGIAMAINVLTKMTADVFIILGVIVCFFGHVFNIALQALGALIHSLRLHYVEFFSKFYEGGGNEFDPFKVTREYTVLERR